jgi:hypothetical protein
MPRFLSLDKIVAIDKHWITERDPLYIGKPSAEYPPGDIDPVRSLIIAELEPELLTAAATASRCCCLSRG